MNFHNLIAWITHLFAHHAAGTLPPAPTPGGSPVALPPAPGVTPPAASAPAAPASAPSPVPSPLPAGIDSPDAHGLVALTGLDPNSHWGKQRYCVQEVALALPVNDPRRGMLIENLRNAQTRWQVGEAHMVGICYECKVGVNEATQEPTYQVDPARGIANSIAVPHGLAMTVFDATAYFKAKPVESGADGSTGKFVPSQP